MNPGRLLLPPRTRRGALPVATSLALLLGGVAAAAPKDSPWGASYFPNVPLVDQDGRRVKFYDDLVKDRHVVVTFIYTSCTQQCGPVVANLVRVQRELRDRVGKDIFFISISMQGERDGPAELKEYARRYRVGPGWTFLTGAPADVALLRKRFGDLGSVEAHAPMINIGNDRIGQWMSTGALDSPKYLAHVVANWLDPRWPSRPPKRSYADLPEAALDVPGRSLFQKRCASCHAPDGDSVGPALHGVVALRGRPWLERWLAGPERMLREEDPTAVALVAAHGGLVMPNPGLQPAQVADVLGYLESLPAPPAPVKGAGGP